jgi:ubiquinone/menaquinone biosynthesis C-methylase UbiE|tara:strand:+ start:56 stop:853 length:798 start_codon:yes stop_codon:yes gene_type:complete
MLSIEEIKLLIEKLEQVKIQDLQGLINTNLKVLKDLELAVDANNKEVINRLDKTPEWFRMDVEQKIKKPVVDEWLYKMVRAKIYQFAKSSSYNSLEIGPGTGMFSKDFRAWRLNYFLDILGDINVKVERRFKPLEKRRLKFYLTRNTECSNIPQSSCNFVFSWDTFVFFTQEHIQQYIHDIKRVLIPGGYCFIQYADCHFDEDLRQAKRGYWNYNTKTAMEKMIIDEGYEIVEMNQFRPGANYAIFRKPGKQNPVVVKVSEIKLD